VISIIKLNETFIQLLNVEDSQKLTISDQLSFFANKYIFTPKYKMGIWDGKIRLYNASKSILYVGLLDNLINVLKKYHYKYELDKKLYKNIDIPYTKIHEYINKLHLPFKPHKYQYKAVMLALNKNRAIIESPTGSGKSFILYLYVKYLLDNVLSKNDKILLVVPVISLVYQMQNDFIEYDSKEQSNIQNEIHIIMGGKNKISNKQIFISTWQSIYDLNKEYFRQFRVLIMDEVHTCNAKSLIKIIESSIFANFRLGTTGTMQEYLINRLQLTGCIGKIYKVESTKSLIEQKILSNLKIYNIILQYPLIDRINARNYSYSDEIRFILNHEKRNLFIANLISKFNENTMVLFKRIKNGKQIYNKLTQISDKNIYYVDGQTSPIRREEIRKLCEKSNNNIIIASTQTFSMGIDIKNLHNIVMLIAGNRKINILQKIGRGLRIHPKKSILKVIDIIDDLKIKREEIKQMNETKISGIANYLLKQFRERLRIYEKEGFECVNKNINL
jgi:superfamily II DNA or RNA helicase